MPRNVTAPRNVEIWNLNGHKATVFTQTEAPDGSDTLVSMVFIPWSEKLVMIHNHDFTSPESAKAVAAKVNTAGCIDLNHWTKFKPNSKERNNPYYPGYATLQFPDEQPS